MIEFDLLYWMNQINDNENNNKKIKKSFLSWQWYGGEHNTGIAIKNVI